MSLRRTWVAGIVFLTLAGLVDIRYAALVHADATISAAALRTALDHPGWRHLMLAVTTTGGPTVVTVAAVVGVIVLLAVNRYRDALFVAVAMLATTGLRLVVLATVARPRPAVRLAPSSGWSFPSGHTTASAAAALCLLLVCRPMLPRPWQRTTLTAVVAGWAFAVGVSRIALVVHWTTDVIGAWLLVATVIPAVAAFQRLFSERLTPSVP